MSYLSNLYVPIIRYYEHPWYPVVCKKGQNIIEQDINGFEYILVKNLQTFEFSFVPIDIYQMPQKSPTIPDPMRLDKISDNEFYERHGEKCVNKN